MNNNLKKLLSMFLKPSLVSDVDNTNMCVALTWMYCPLLPQMIIFKKTLFQKKTTENYFDMWNGLFFLPWFYTSHIGILLYHFDFVESFYLFIKSRHRNWRNNHLWRRLSLRKRRKLSHNWHERNSPYKKVPPFSFF